MKKLFISQPMRNKTDEEIKSERTVAIAKAKEKLGEDVEIIDSFIENEPNVKMIPVWYLGESIKLLSEANAAYFAPGWQDTRGCLIEYSVATTYGIKVILSEFDAHKTTIGRRLDAGLFD